MRIRKYKRDTILRAHFLDIFQDPRWKQFDLAASRPPHADTDCRVVGYYTTQDSEFLYLADMIGGAQRNQTVIPRGCITKIEVLRGKMMDEDVKKLVDEVKELRDELRLLREDREHKEQVKRNMWPL